MVSGSTSLRDIDANYYVVDAAKVAAGQVVSWWGESEEMTAPTTISQIEVRFTGKSSKKDVVVEFFVKEVTKASRQQRHPALPLPRLILIRLVPST